MMKLTIWLIAIPSHYTDPLARAFVTVLGKSIRFQPFPEPFPDPGGHSPLPDLIVADISKNSDTLQTLLLSLRQHRPVDLIVATGDRSVSTFTRARQLGAVDYLLLPFPAYRAQDCIRRYVSLRNTLRFGSLLTQADLDRLFPAVDHRPKDGEPLCDEVLSYLQAHPQGALVKEAAAALCLSPSACRRLLEKMAQQGKIRRCTQTDGQVGRPKVRYLLD